MKFYILEFMRNETKKHNYYKITRHRASARGWGA